MSKVDALSEPDSASPIAGGKTKRACSGLRYDVLVRYQYRYLIVA